MGSLLPEIDQPADLKGLAPAQLQQLAAEIRQELVATITSNGGHLASNLGVVELTIALHRAFASPRDKIVWDVGHQSYVHKLLTGRRHNFPTIRQYGGISGFPERAESPHDPFGAGHAGTSISAALGMATARDLAGEDYHVVAVVGDGALTAGMSLEALNNAGHVGNRLIVVLNDNGMSISPNVGALDGLFNKVRLSYRYHRAKEEAEQLVVRLPLGKNLWRWAKRLKDSIKGLVIPTMIWEELGFTYMGPVDGHNIAELEAVFRQAQGYPSKPTFIHIVTLKGKGYHPAEGDAIRFHGVSPQPAMPPTEEKEAPSYTRVFAQTTLRLAKSDPRIVAITAAMLEGTGLATVAQEMPQRVFDVGICEQHAVTFAAGLATQGLRPIVAIYSTFLQRAYDQVIHDVCIQNLPVTFALDRAGVVGEDGKTHQGAFDLAFLRCVPNMVIAAPRDENELQHLLYTAVNHPGPMAVRYPRGNGTGACLDEELRPLPIGKGELLRQGSHVAILALGNMVAPALAAAERLATLGIECAVVNARFVKPLDSSLILDLARKLRRVVTAEENTTLGGFGSAVGELLMKEKVEGVALSAIGLPDHFIEHGSPELMRSQLGLDAAGIAQHILAAFPDLTPRPLVKAAT